MLFHTYWDLYCQVSLFVSIERTMYFHCRSLQSLNLIVKNLSLYQIKTSYYGKCLNDFYSCDALKKLTRLFFWCIATHEWKWFVRTFHGIISIFHDNEIHLWLHFPCQQEGILSALVNLSDTESDTSREMISRCVSSQSWLRFLSSLRCELWPGS